MLPRRARFLLPLIAAGVILSFAGFGWTQQPAADPDMKARLDQHEKEIQELQAILEKLQSHVARRPHFDSGRRLFRAP